jgi:hypothetical protein
MSDVCPPSDLRVVVLDGDQSPPPQQWPEEICYEFPVLGQLTATVRRPVDFRLNWLKETSKGMLRNPLPMQFASKIDATIRIAYMGNLRGRAWRTGSSIAIEYVSSPDPASVTVEVEPWQHPEPDPLLAALLGVHPLGWFRESAVKGGSHEWKYTSRLQEVSVATLETISALWEKLDPESEMKAWMSFGADGRGAREALGGDEELFEAAQRVYDYAVSLEDWTTMPGWTKKRLVELLGEREDERFAGWSRFRDHLHEAASKALALMISSRPAPKRLASGIFPIGGQPDDGWPKAWAGDISAMDFALEPRPRLEIEMPFITRHSIRWVSDKLDSFHASIEPAGRIVVYSATANTRTEADTIRAVLIPFAAEYAHHGERWDCTPDGYFHYERTAVSPSDWAVWSDILGWFGRQAPSWPGEPVTAAVSVTLPAQRLASWLDAPLPRDAAFDEVFNQVGERLQRLLRAWLPALWFAGVQRFENPKEAYPLLAYAAAPTAQECGEPTYTFDSGRAGVVLKIRDGIRKRGPDVLQRAQERLKLAGADHLLPLYGPDKVCQLARTIARKARGYDGLLRRESRLMEELMRVTTKVRELRLVMKTEPESAARTLAHLAADAAAWLNKHMSGMYLDEAAPPLEQILFMEAACALSGESLSSVGRIQFTIERHGARQTWLLE